VLPVGRITHGGHPTITPLLAMYVREAGLDPDRLTIFQSKLHAAVLPRENAHFSDIRMIDAVGTDLVASHRAMREAMITSRPFKAAVFIGGMEGIQDEAALFAQTHPNAALLPVATTGAGAAELAERIGTPDHIRTERTYPTLFRRFLIET